MPNNQVVKKRAKFPWGRLFTLGLIALLTINYLRPLPDAVMTISLPQTIPAETPVLEWPTAGEAAVSAEGYDFLASNNPNVQVSTASITKIIAALTILDAKPLAPGQAGPVITMNEADVARYQMEVARDGSNLPVSVGEKLTQYQMLQAIILPSANNITDGLAIWAFGSLENYRLKAQEFVRKNGMTATVIGADASGYDPGTKSTPRDLVKLAKLAVDHPIVSEIAAQKSVTFPTAGEMRNHNRLAGNGFMTGLKTGRNDENTGGLLFSARSNMSGKAVDIVGVVIDAGTLDYAIRASQTLARSAEDDFITTTPATKGMVVGKVKTAWGAETNIVAGEDADLPRWSGSEIIRSNQLSSVTGTKAVEVGQIRFRSDGNTVSVPVGIVEPAAKPSFWWRLTRF